MAKRKLDNMGLYQQDYGHSRTGACREDVLDTLIDVLNDSKRLGLERRVT